MKTERTQLSAEREELDARVPKRQERSAGIPAFSVKYKSNRLLKTMRKVLYPKSGVGEGIEQVCWAVRGPSGHGPKPHGSLGFLAVVLESRGRYQWTTGCILEDSEGGRTRR